MVSYLFFVMIMFEGCKDISEYNTVMTSFLKCMCVCVPANATNRTSCHTNDVNRGFYFVSIVAVIDVLLLFFSYIKNNNQKDASVLTIKWRTMTQAYACIHTNETNGLLLTGVVSVTLMKQIHLSILWLFVACYAHSFNQVLFFSKEEE